MCMYRYVQSSCACNQGEVWVRDCDFPVLTPVPGARMDLCQRRSFPFRTWHRQDPCWGCMNAGWQAEGVSVLREHWTEGVRRYFSPVWTAGPQWRWLTGVPPAYWRRHFLLRWAGKFGGYMVRRIIIGLWNEMRGHFVSDEQIANARWSWGAVLSFQWEVDWLTIGG